LTLGQSMRWKVRLGTSRRLGQELNDGLAASGMVAGRVIRGILEKVTLLHIKVRAMSPNFGEAVTAMMSPVSRPGHASRLGQYSIPKTALIFKSSGMCSKLRRFRNNKLK